MVDCNSDEIKEIQDRRSIVGVKAIWRLFDYQISTRLPAVYTMRVQLEMVYILNQETKRMLSTVKVPEKRNFDEFSTFTHTSNTKVSYINFPANHVWDKRTPRRRDFSAIGRIVTIIYLRILLNHNHSAGEKCLKYSENVNGQICSTFKEACFY